MAFTIHKKNFFDVVQKAYALVPTKSSLQTLLNIKLAFKNGFAELYATDLDHSIRIGTPLSGKGNFEITVNAKKLFEIVRELHDDELTISIDENVLTLESGGTFSCKISGTDTRDFPAFPEIASLQTFAVPVGMLKDMIIKSCFAASKDETRACLCGVLWEVTKDTSGMVATDGHRLGSSFYTGEYETSENVSSILAPKTLMNLVRILDEVQEDSLIQVSLGDKYILFSNQTITLCSKLIDGPYPDYEKVIPKSNNKRAVINKALLLEAVRRVSVLSNQKTHLVKFSFRKKELEIVVLNRDIGGEARQLLPIVYEGDEHVIGFNAAYLIEILSIIKTESVRLEMNTQISPCLLFPFYEKEEDKKCDDLFLIMPLRILDEIE